MKKPVISIVATVTITLALLISAVPALAHGLILESVEEPGGLRLVLSGNNGLFNLKNMAPGDAERATLTIKNSCSRPCHFYMQIKRGDQPLSTPDLLRQLEFTVTDGDTTLFQGLVDNLGLIDLGSYARGESHDLSVGAHLPWETNNDYQRLSANVKFIFTVKASGNGGNGDNSGGGGGGGKPRPKPKPLEAIEVPPEEPPVGSSEIPAESKVEPPEPLEVEMLPEPVPIGAPPVMPETGQEAPYPYYLLGGMALLAGTQLACTGQRQHNGKWTKFCYRKDTLSILGFLKKQKGIE